MDEEKKDVLFEKYFTELPCAQVRYLAYLYDQILWRELPTDAYMELMKLIQKAGQFKTADELVRDFYSDSYSDS